MKRHLIRKVCILTAGIGLLCLAINAVHASEVQKSVLILFDARSDMLSNVVVEQTIRRVLGEEFSVDVDIRSEYLEANPLPQEDFPVLLSWLRRKYAGRTFDVVVPVGASSLEFVRDHGHELFETASLVFWGRKAVLDGWNSAVPITGVVAPAMDAQIMGTFAFMRALQPDLEQLIVVTGTSSVDRTWETSARRELGPYEGGITITYLAGLRYEDLKKRLASLPSKSAILFFSVMEDGAGRRLLRTQFLKQVVESASAPVYSTSALYLDTGIVGGDVLDQEAMAAKTAGLISPLLHGEDIRKIPVVETPLVPMVNWRAMNRWRLDGSNLPAGTVIRLKDPSFWDAYKWHVISLISLCLIEGGLIVALLIHRAKRRRAERSMEESEVLLQSTIDALSARVGLLDEDGNVLVVNRRWATFAEENSVASNGVGTNYLETRAAATCEESRLVADGIRSLMSGELSDFRCVYQYQPSGSWFQVRVNRFEMYGVLRLVVAHEDVTEIKRAHDTQQQLTGLLLRAQDDERRRIARDLHDVTVQNMVAIKADLIGVERRAVALDRRASEMLQESLSLCNQVIKELRTLSYLLHPPFLDEAGLVPSIQWFVRGFIQRSGVEVALMMNEVGRLPKKVETALFRVVQESLTNIHRHSGSRSAVIWLTKEQDTVLMRVTDYGRGFSLSTPENHDGAPSPGVGIPGMRERLKQLGGELAIESSPQGTRVNARVSILEDQINAYSIGR